MTFPKWKNIIVSRLEEKEVNIMDVFTDDLQRQLLMVKGLERLTRNDLANEIGVSLPTMTRLINNKTPFAIQNNVYKRLTNWLSEHRVVATQDK
ncbi:hypothetical protein [Limosilactobacillus reuteri]|uniref:hypothetical protein n=2 Tax=Limosilactobacillus reuteri TaxID=1598 RepID=UPI002B055382|nr:hypothetical protein [Limosilactobacillus reuteri]